MSRILLGWELGGGFGHVSSLMILAQALKARGHTPVVALIQFEGTRAVWDGKGIEVVPAPGFPQRTATQKHDTLADVMVDSTAFTADRLPKLVHAWNSVLSRVRPAVVVCDFAPSLALTARGRVPIAVVGSGYTVPPPLKSFPPMRFWRATRLDAASLGNERRLLETFNATARSSGTPTYAQATDILRGDETFVSSLPELDCYGALRSEPGIGSLNGQGTPSRDSERSGLFAYLAANPDLDRWVTGIGDSGVPAEAYVRDAAVMPPPSVVLHDRPADIGATLPRKLLVLHHGGNLAESALRMGIPQMLIPRTRDQEITGKLVARQGIGELIEPAMARNPRLLAESIRKMAHSEKVQAAAWALAEKIAARRTPNPVETIVVAIERLAS